MCHCGLQPEYDDCCGRYVSGRDIAPTAEALMRSRYSGFVECNDSYLLASWHPDTRPSRVRFDPDQRWLGLKIRAIEAGTETDSAGIVEFEARFKVHGKGHRLHEISRFERIDGRWYYLDGQHLGATTA